MEIFVFLFTNLMFQNPKKQQKTRTKEEKTPPKITNQTNKTKAIFCDYEVQHINQ
jgi:hypothetical protein